MKETLEFIKTMNKYIGAICQNNNETESEREQAIIEFANEAIQQVKDNIVLGSVSKCQHTGDTKHWEETKQLRCLKCKEAF